MDTLLKIVLIISMALFLYNYFLYPLVVIILSKLITDPHADIDRDANYYPSVSFIIAAYNEEKVIREKLLNTLEIDYPEDKLQIMVVSDGSDDSTPDIVNSFKDQGVIGLHEVERNGKSAALNRAVEQCNGEIIVFSDANNDFNKDSVKLLVDHFQDENIGAVTGSKHIYAKEGRESSTGDGMYWKYESRIKKAESDLFQEVWLYRHPTEYFSTDKLYLYFDETSKLIEIEYKPANKE